MQHILIGTGKMGMLFDRLMQDVRFVEGFNACIHCGTCTAICPAAEFYDYDPRLLVDIIQTRDENVIEKLLKSEIIWYCGECMSCKTRCPRGNAPGLIIMALRLLSQDMGYFIESEKGRQQLAVKRSIGHWILQHGYCLYPPEIEVERHPEQGPIWKWELDNLHALMERFGANFGGEGPGIFRRIPDDTLEEIRNIFEVTGGMEHFRKIEDFSAKKAEELRIELKDGTDNDYFNYVFG